MLLRREADGLIFLGHSMSKSVSAMMKRNQMAPIVNGCEYSPSLLLGVLQRTVTSPVSITLPHKLQIRSSTGAPPRPPPRADFASRRRAADLAAAVSAISGCTHST
jgi:hypothetical protein